MDANKLRQSALAQADLSFNPKNLRHGARLGFRVARVTQNQEIKISARLAAQLIQIKSSRPAGPRV
jgi:hypothetical protein